MSNIPLPKPDDLKNMLSMMYDDLSVDDGEPAEAGKYKCAVALYLDDNDAPIAAAVADYPFAAYSGAALTMIPPGGAQDAVEEGDLGNSILENVNEVFNICSRLLMNDSSPHLRLGPIYTSMDEVPEDQAAVVKGPNGRADIAATIPNYGSGNISFMI
ncbi:MAG: hypothetical protein AAGI88_20980 [Pseudomonadota bacterium]